MVQLCYKMAETKFRAPQFTLILALLLHYWLPSSQHPIPNASLNHPDRFIVSRSVKSNVSSALFIMLGDRKPSSILASRRGLLLLCLLLCGDISTNPGPKASCGLCSKALRSNQKGIDYEECLT